MLAGLIHRADLDGLVRLVDDCCATRDWARLRRLRDDARHAVGTGRQLWPAATLAEYRLALLAPAAWAAGVLDEGSGRFTIGPLTEVVAQHHTWAELAPLLEPGPRAAFVAHERALRGEAIDRRRPRRRCPTCSTCPYAARRRGSPTYCLATYDDDGGEFPAPDAAGPLGRRRAAGRRAPPPLDDDAVELAVRQLVEPWTATSNGRAEVVAVEGDAAGAAARARRAARPLGAARRAAEAVAWLAWAGASGGAHGRRRGAAAGRFGALWLRRPRSLDAARRLAAPARRARRARRRAALVVVGRPRAGDRLAAAARRRGPGRGRGLGDQRPRRRLTRHPSACCIECPCAGRPASQHSDGGAMPRRRRSTI